MENWKKIMVMTDLLRANSINATLHGANIDTALINKKDSAYVFLGEYHIYVRNEDVDRAIATLKDADDRYAEAELNAEN